ncbi:hypothetical protein SALWKB12_1257 [Snodgrassella communis]|uniref:hypothetical protein n=1 Tax=Snodgrassella communis TaxID=2946699 RepID=UPI000461E279|nr:hypothetical protein [Snodgrassella communis]KDN12733.1 hypothetical protein SALWKB12_1257 [Snodgrassella communis]
MVTETTLQSDLVHNVDFDSILTTLTNLSEESIEPDITAKWFVIKISPDLATGELLNIGVGIIYRKKLFTKLIPNTTPLELLYGKASKENFSFLLHLLKSSTDSLLTLKSVSPHFSISSLKFVAGNSVEDILDRLYKSMVTLNLIQTSEKQNNHKGLSTEKVRSKIFNAIKNSDKYLAESIWHNENNPIVIPPDLGEKITLKHLQIWSTPNILQQHTKFGAIVSTDYIQATQSEFYLLQATQDIQRASASLNNNKEAGLFIYRPDTLPEKILDNVDNIIDHTHWLIKKNIGSRFTMEVESNMDTLINKTHAFAT